MNNINILLIDDVETMREPLKIFLMEKGYTVIEASDGEEALEIFQMKKDEIHLILLDVMMPKVDGWTVLRRIRSESKVPIVMLTVREEDEDELFGFELGVDEYISKPYNLKIVEARISSLLKKVIKNVKECSDYGKICIDFEGRIVEVNGEKVHLALREYELLTYLIENKDIVVSRDKILNAVWHYDYYGDTRTIDNHVKKLRKKLGEEAGEYIETIRGVGYKFRVK